MNNNVLIFKSIKMMKFLGIISTRIYSQDLAFPLDKFFYRPNHEFHFHNDGIFSYDGKRSVVGTTNLTSIKYANFEPSKELIARTFTLLASRCKEEAKRKVARYSMPSLTQYILIFNDLKFLANDV